MLAAVTDTHEHNIAFIILEKSYWLFGSWPYNDFSHVLISKEVRPPAAADKHVFPNVNATLFFGSIGLTEWLLPALNISQSSTIIKVPNVMRVLELGLNDPAMF